MLDYIIVGQGLAGSCLAHTLIKQDKKFVIINKLSNSASFVSSGMYNPVVLKRFTPVWNAQKEIDSLSLKFQELEQLLNTKLLYKQDLYRIFANEDEVKTWQKKSIRNENLIPFLDPRIYYDINIQIKADFGLGKVLQSGKVLVKEFLFKFREYLNNSSRLIEEQLDFNFLYVEKDKIQYKGIEAKKIVFADGYALKNNPFFSDLPMEGLKGETMQIYSPELKLENIVKAKVFIMPMGSDHYYVGATYNYNELDDFISEGGKNELIENLKKFLKADFTIIKQFAGIRPTVIDRRPLLGSHQDKKNVFILNGLGSRGVMLAPVMAEELYNFIENGVDLQLEVDIKRFN